MGIKTLIGIIVLGSIVIGLLIAAIISVSIDRFSDDDFKEEADKHEEILSVCESHGGPFSYDKVKFTCADDVVIRFKKG